MIETSGRTRSAVHRDGSVVLFFLFLSGVVLALRGESSILPPFLRWADRLPCPVELLFSLLALFFGGTPAGVFLIPPLSFLYGAAAALRCGSLLEAGGSVSSLAGRLVPIPAFFLLCAMGMLSSLRMMSAFLLSGRRERRAICLAFLIRLGLFALTALSFVFLGA